MKRVLICCGWLVTLDGKIGDFRNGELLYSGNRIEAVGRNLGATADEVIDATDKIVMPGLVNAHMHTWQTALRGIASEWMSPDYFKYVHGNMATLYKPEDNYLGNLIGALAQIDAGVTTLVDWCHNVTHLEMAWRWRSAPSTVLLTAAFAPCSPTAPRSRSTRRKVCRSPTCRIRATASRRCARAGSQVTTAG
jgi:5-methylthioadenosine/S-adenosylhomocysteine deaminase